MRVFRRSCAIFDQPRAKERVGLAQSEEQFYFIFLPKGDFHGCVTVGGVQFFLVFLLAADSSKLSSI